MLFNKNIDPQLKNLINKNLLKSCRILIICKDTIEPIEKRILSYKGTVIHSISSINCICAKISTHYVERISEFPQVKYITLDGFAFLCANDIKIENSTNYISSQKYTGENIGVGIIDSGVFPHPDLLNPHNKIYGFKDLINNYNYPYDDNGHGTFISGIICGSGHSSKGIYKGISTGAHIYMVKAFSSTNKGYIGDILYAYQDILINKDNYNIKVICLPFETIDFNSYILSLFSQLFVNATNAGITTVVAAGNNGNFESSLRGISTLQNCITVSGIDNTNIDLLPYKGSSFGPWGKLEKPEICAPCVNITSLNCNINYISERNGIKLYPQKLHDFYTHYTGTSIAAAYISSVCALIYEKYPTIEFKDIYPLLKFNCELTNNYKWSQGCGLIDIDKLLST